MYIQSVAVCKFLFYSLGTNICFADKAIYTQEVLAVVLQQLLDEIPIPVLFMRSVSYEVKLVFVYSAIIIIIMKCRFCKHILCIICLVFFVICSCQKTSYLQHKCNRKC